MVTTPWQHHQQQTEIGIARFCSQTMAVTPESPLGPAQVDSSQGWTHPTLVFGFLWKEDSVHEMEIAFDCL